jgi:hypothetical protein
MVQIIYILKNHPVTLREQNNLLPEGKLRSSYDNPQTGLLD